MDFSLLREYEGEDARVALSTVVARAGLDSPSLREIARTAVRSPSTLLAWFGTKRELHRRALLALGVRWYHCLQEHPIPADPRDLEHARLRLAFEELARTDAAVAEVLDEVIAFERARLVAWVERYVPARSWLSRDEPRPMEEATVAVLHAAAVALWDARRFPDRDAARRDFEQACALILLGAGQLFSEPRRPATVEQTSGDAAQAAGPTERSSGTENAAWPAERSSDPDDGRRPAERSSEPPWLAALTERLICTPRTPSTGEQLSGGDEDRRERERAFEEATRPPYTIIRPHSSEPA